MTAIKPIQFLAELRELVLQRSLRRMPKWRFRVAPDLVLQLQPKPTVLPSALATELGATPRFHHLEGQAVMTERADGKMLDRLPKQDAPWWQQRFSIFADHPDACEWKFYRQGGSRKRGADVDGFNQLERRILEAVDGGFFHRLQPEALLHPQCLCCGKQLTDPASMARMIGPECAGSSSLKQPFIIGIGAAP